MGDDGDDGDGDDDCGDDDDEHMGDDVIHYAVLLANMSNSGHHERVHKDGNYHNDA